MTARGLGPELNRKVPNVEPGMRIRVVTEPVPSQHAGDAVYRHAFTGVQLHLWQQVQVVRGCYYAR